MPSPETTDRAAQRADVALVARGLFESRALAQAAIAAGLVSADGAVVRKASTPPAIKMRALAIKASCLAMLFVKPLN